MVTIEELAWGQVVQGLVGADGVVRALPGEVVGAELGDGATHGEAFEELLGVGAIGTFDGAIELGAARWQDEEPQAVLLTGDFERAHELTAAIDLDGADGERHSGEDGIERLGRRPRGCPVVEVEHIPATNDVVGSELLQDFPGEWPDVDGVELHQIAWEQDAIAGWFPDGMEPPCEALARRDVPAWRFVEHPAPFQIGQDATDTRDRDNDPVGGQQRLQFRFAPTWIAFAHRLHGQDLGATPGPAAQAFRSARTALEGVESGGMVTAFPAVEGLAADAEVATCQGGIAVLGVVIEPFEALLGVCRQVRLRSFRDRQLMGHRAAHQVNAAALRREQAPGRVRLLHESLRRGGVLGRSHPTVGLSLCSATGPAFWAPPKLPFRSSRARSLMHRVSPTCLS